MNQIDKVKKLNNLNCFDKNTLSQFVELSDNSLYANIKRWLKSGRLISLKKGLYVTADYLAAQRNMRSYTEFVANKLREPSYLSMEYMLQHYNIISEAVYGFTSVTRKSKRIYTNAFGVFVYRNMKETLFTGYVIQRIDDFQVKVATKAKALFDYFYYKLFRIPEVDAGLVASFRLNYDELTSAELKEFAAYCRLAQTKKMLTLMHIVRKAR